MQRNGDPVVLCFVDFENPACAATARTALQGKMRFSLFPKLVILGPTCFALFLVIYLSFINIFLFFFFFF